MLADAYGGTGSFLEVGVASAHFEVVFRPERVVREVGRYLF